MSPAAYGVWCIVSGGITGRREAWLKASGEVWTGTEAEAEEKAREARSTISGYSSARFHYYAKAR